MSATKITLLLTRVFVVIDTLNSIFNINTKKVGFMNRGAIAQITRIPLGCQFGMSQTLDYIVGNWLCELK